MITTLLQLCAVVADWRKRRTAILELSRLSDVTLRDIGVCRADIPRVVDEALTAERNARIPCVVTRVQRPVFESHEVC
jgi:uncharacterized protein YjiS (DUF1127 family)